MANLVDVTDRNFVAEVMQSPIPVVIDFWAEWCAPCRAIHPFLEAIAGELKGAVKIVRVDVDANPALAQQFRIQRIPTLIIVKGGKILAQTGGAASKEALQKAIEQALGRSS